MILDVVFVKLKRDQINKKILIVDDSDSVDLELYFVPSFFLFVFPTNKLIVISQDDDEIFYHNLEWLMNNSYEFPHKYSKKSEDELIWLSEQCYNIDDKDECDMVSRLIIKRINGEFYISYSNPFFEKYAIDREGIVSFSPAGNGFLSKNIETGLTLQDDMIKIFYNTLYEKKIDYSKSLKKVRNNKRVKQ